MKKVLLNLLTIALLLSYSHVWAGKGEYTVISPMSVQSTDVKDLIGSIPSPLETTFLLKDLGTAYKKSNLNNPDFVGNYSTSYDQALNLGAYGTDLGFATIYNKNQDVLNFLESVKKLADNLNIGDHFDLLKLSKMTKDGKIDELMLETTQNLQEISNDLQGRKQEHLSVLLVAGGWIEANYLTSLVYMDTKNKDLKNKIAEQKLVVNKLIEALSVYKSKPRFGDLITDLQGLKKVYDKIQIVQTSGKAVTKVVNGEIVVETEGGSYEVKAADSDIQAISGLLKSIRSKIVKK